MANALPFLQSPTKGALTFEPREAERQVNGLSPSLRFGDATQFESLLEQSFAN